MGPRGRAALVVEDHLQAAKRPGRLAISIYIFLSVDPWIPNPTFIYYFDTGQFHCFQGSTLGSGGPQNTDPAKVVNLSIIDYCLRIYALRVTHMALRYSFPYSRRIRAFYKSFLCLFCRRPGLLDNGHVIHYCRIEFVVDFIRKSAFEVVGFVANAIYTFRRQVQSKMGAVFAVNRTGTYDTIVGTGDVVLAGICVSITFGVFLKYELLFWQ